MIRSKFSGAQVLQRKSRLWSKRESANSRNTKDKNYCAPRLETICPASSTMDALKCGFEPHVQVGKSH